MPYKTGCILILTYKSGKAVRDGGRLMCFTCVEPLVTSSTWQEVADSPTCDNIINFIVTYSVMGAGEKKKKREKRGGQGAVTNPKKGRLILRA